jgi:hypothetical protein
MRFCSKPFVPSIYFSMVLLPSSCCVVPSQLNISVACGVSSSSTSGVFYTRFYNHAHCLRLEKLLYIELSRSPSGYFKPLLDPGGGFRSETALTKPFRKWNGYKFIAVVCNGHSPADTGVRSGVTVMAVGQRQRLYHILVSGCLTGIILVPLPGHFGAQGPNLN